MINEKKFNEKYEKIIKFVEEISNEISIPVMENIKKECIVKTYRLFCDKFYRTISNR